MSDTLEDRLARLRRRFRDRAETECGALEGLADELKVGEDGARLQEQIRGIAHGLAGAGGIFGFVGISACAAELEEFVSDVPNSPELADACMILVSEIRRTEW